MYVCIKQFLLISGEIIDKFFWNFGNINCMFEIQIFKLRVNRAFNYGKNSNLKNKIYFKLLCKRKYYKRHISAAHAWIHKHLFKILKNL